MERILARVRSQLGTSWVGSSVIHLGDHNVPNALIFIDKYSQVLTISSDSCLRSVRVVEIVVFNHVMWAVNRWLLSIGGFCQSVAAVNRWLLSIGGCCQSVAAVNRWLLSIGGCCQSVASVNRWLLSIGGCCQSVAAVNRWLLSIGGCCQSVASVNRWLLSICPWASPFPLSASTNLKMSFSLSHPCEHGCTLSCSPGFSVTRCGPGLTDFAMPCWADREDFESHPAVPSTPARGLRLLPTHRLIH
jgi:hypothetical protein